MTFITAVSFLCGSIDILQQGQVKLKFSQILCFEIQYLSNTYPINGGKFV